MPMESELQVMGLNIAICDDEKVIREQIKELAEKEMPDVCAVLYETGDALLAAGKQFMDMFQKQISDMKLLSQKKAAAYYQYSMQAYSPTA